MNNPPLGVSPAWFFIPNRINDLSGAISRYSKHDDIMKNKEVCDAMKKWAQEIICHCDTIQKIIEKETAND